MTNVIEFPCTSSTAELFRLLPRRLINTIRQAQKVEVFTGAGMSKDSGLDTFRDAQTGIWSHVDPQATATIDSWARDPDPMLAWYLWRGTLCRRAKPNPGHLAIAQWAGRNGVDLHITTQNIDDLHERAFDDAKQPRANIAHLHGSLFAYRCSICSKPARTPELPEEQVERIVPPQCSLCGNPIRPGVVWFGESLPHKEWIAAEHSMRSADVVIIIGTSGVIWPAAGLPALAAEASIPIIEISPDRTDLTSLATWSIRTTAARGVPALIAAMEGGASS
ncbi:NAD-dependent protein deacylase [Corynebacterium anserum]|uniref:NAD-dependent protein deacylase n=1 Tax=Corynebacterium anserum TaxID=2684406 RepID=A0A7G7YLH9_9CORY|nr:NAD-dependent protein deacylase [Corynebacterium anserum]QNH95349.1 NAD-dependent protein deacylase [Corynebacterium anserum]